MLSAISRKDFFSQTRDNEAYVTEELNDLIGNDTWQVYHPYENVCAEWFYRFMRAEGYCFLGLDGVNISEVADV
jgi:hypothetical protein